MITKTDIFKLVKKITRHNRGIKERQLLNPEREWAIGILAFTMLLIAGFWYNATLFSYYQNIEDNLTNETVSIPNYNYGTLDRVLMRYDERSRQFEEIKSGIMIEQASLVVDDISASSTASSTLENTNNSTTTENGETEMENASSSALAE